MRNVNEKKLAKRVKYVPRWSKLKASKKGWLRGEGDVPFSDGSIDLGSGRGGGG